MSLTQYCTKWRGCPPASCVFAILPSGGSFASTLSNAPVLTFWAAASNYILLLLITTCLGDNSTPRLRRSRLPCLTQTSHKIFHPWYASPPFMLP